jgi:hypothetical protein
MPIFSARSFHTSRGEFHHGNHTAFNDLVSRQPEPMVMLLSPPKLDRFSDSVKQQPAFLSA